MSELLQQRDGGVLRLTLNRPERRNALSRSLIAELDRAFRESADDPDVRAIVLAAEGTVFSSGHDLGEVRGMSDGEAGKLFAECAAMMQRVRALPQPVIARVQGLATAAGCQLVATCDLAVAAEGALFATPGVRIGLFCTTPMVPLVRSIPPKLALEMLLTGKPITAAQALAAGLISRVVPAEELDASIAEITSAIVAASPATIRIGKGAFYDQLTLSEPAAYERAVEVMTGNISLADAREGIAAFLEKRPPQWKRPAH